MAKDTSEARVKWASLFFFQRIELLEEIRQIGDPPPHIAAVHNDFLRLDQSLQNRLISKL